MPMDKDRLKRIKKSYTEFESEKKPLELEHAEDVEMKPSGDAGFDKTEKEDAELPKDAPLKTRITRSIIQLMKRKGPPKEN